VVGQALAARACPDRPPWGAPGEPYDICSARRATSTLLPQAKDGFSFLLYL